MKLKHYPIDITMTAVLRPKVIDKTLESISRNIVQGTSRFRLILNIDLIGEKVKPKIIVKIAKKYFKENLIFRVSEEPSFAKAVIWTWKTSTSPFIFHIEDDWKITKPININNMLEILLKYKELSSLRLYKYSTPKRKVFTTFGCKWRYNKDGFYIADGWKKQFGLNPILIRREFLNEALPQMRNDVNPEKQFRDTQPYMKLIIEKWKYGLYTKPGSKALAIDTGTVWRRNTNFVKPKGKPFLTWEETK